jgi:hypothetical protein
MQRRPVIAAVVLTVALVIFLGAHNDAPRPLASAHSLTAAPRAGQAASDAPRRLPPPWQSLQVSEPALMRLALAGDRPAAERLFVEARQCLKARRLRDFFRGTSYRAWVAANRSYLAGLDPARRDRTLRGVRANIDLVNASERLCGNTDATLSGGRIYPIAFAAARLGDDDATACILAGVYDPPKMTPSQAAAFDGEAMELGRRALAHGHWKTVLALEMVYGYSGVEGQTGPVSHIDAAGYLRMLRLQWRGTPPGTAEASALARQIEAVEGRLAPFEQLAAERWADETYARAFAASGPIVDADLGGCDW